MFALGSVKPKSSIQKSSDLKGRISEVKVEESASDCEISGKVTDENGEPIIGAVIINKATKKGVVTDLNGAYKMSVQKGAAVEVLYAGYKKTIVKLGKNALQEINIVLKQDVSRDTQKKKEVLKKTERGLVLVDGEIYENSLDEISIEKIEKITVVKYKNDLAPYIEKYGNNAKHGVVLVSLKK